MEAKQINLSIKHASNDHQVSVEASSSVANLKKVLAEKFSIATTEQKLICKGTFRFHSFQTLFRKGLER